VWNERDPQLTQVAHLFSCVTYSHVHAYITTYQHLQAQCTFLHTRRQKDMNKYDPCGHTMSALPAAQILRYRITQTTQTRTTQALHFVLTMSVHIPALGDGYLKREKLSQLPYKNHVPYITGKPKVRLR